MAEATLTILLLSVGRILIVLLGLLSIFFAGYNFKAKQYMLSLFMALGGLLIIAGQVMTFLAFIGPMLKDHV